MIACKEDPFSTVKTLGPQDTPSKYSIAKRLGSGCFGSVYIGFDDKNKSVAIKLLMNKRDYLKEVKCLQYIQKICGNDILCILDYFEFTQDQQKIYCIVTEYEPGYISFSNYIDNNQPFSKQKANTIISNIIDALNKIHLIQVSHTDLHEDNLLIHPDTLQIKLIDFGACYIFEFDDDPNKQYTTEIDDIYMLALIKSINRK